MGFYFIFLVLKLGQNIFPKRITTSNYREERARGKIRMQGEWRKKTLTDWIPKTGGKDSKNKSFAIYFCFNKGLNKKRYLRVQLLVFIIGYFEDVCGLFFNYKSASCFLIIPAPQISRDRHNAPLCDPRCVAGSLGQDIRLPGLGRSITKPLLSWPT